MSLHANSLFKLTPKRRISIYKMGERLEFNKYGENLAIERVDELVEEVVGQVEDLLEKQKNLIGKGRTAEVHFVEKNPENCLKIIYRGEGLSTVQNSETGSSPKYLPLSV